MALSENGSKSLQIYTLVNLKLVTAIATNVTSFDCRESDTIFRIYAVQISKKVNAAATGQYFLIEKVISVENLIDYQKYVPVDNCGAKLIALEKILVIVCPTYNNKMGKVGIYLRHNLTLVKEYIGN
jgi:hypothetical protein